jgi:hypothetical protein
MFLPSFQINSLARAMLFLINFKKIIGTHTKKQQTRRRKQPMINNNASLLVTVEQLEQQRQQHSKPTIKQ